jgi:hypothetical protein
VQECGHGDTGNGSFLILNGGRCYDAQPPVRAVRETPSLVHEAPTA